MVRAGQGGARGAQAPFSAPAGAPDSAEPHAPGPPQPRARPLPPVAAFALASLILVIAGGIDLAAHLPRPAPIPPAAGFLAAAVAALLAAVGALARARDFAWGAFRVVAGWTLAAYVVIAGMLEFVFVLDHTPGSLLTLLTLMLAVFAVDIPLLLAFSVARFQPSNRGQPGRGDLDGQAPERLSR